MEESSGWLEELKGESPNSTYNTETMHVMFKIFRRTLITLYYKLKCLATE